jgi:hypothetical protein
MADPEFRIVDGTAFPGAIAIAASTGVAVAAAERRYLDQLIATQSAFAPLDKQPAIGKRQNGVRVRAVGELRKGAERFVALASGADRVAEAERLTCECLRVEGRYKEWISRIGTIPFVVTPVDVNGQPLDPDGKDLFHDVELVTRDVLITPEQQALKTSLDSALGVVRVVFAERAARTGNRLFFSRDAVQALRLRRHDYVSQLYGIATVGLSQKDDSHPAFALADLVRFKGEFRDREAGLVKNDYLWRLGGWCLLAIVVAALCYFAARSQMLGVIGYNLRRFFLLIVGASLGTWLSFSLRREVLSFEDLAVLERDQLDPSTRVLFIIGLVVVVGLLFWTSAITVGIGQFGTSDAMHKDGPAALLAGLLAGIAERALSTVVSKRAADFAGAIGGKPGP